MSKWLNSRSLITHSVPGLFTFSYPAKAFYLIQLLLCVCPFVVHCGNEQQMNGLESVLKVLWLAGDGGRWGLLEIVKAEEMPPDCRSLSAVLL